MALMGEKEFAEKIAGEAHISAGKAETAVRALLEAIEQALAGGDVVNFSGYFSMYVDDVPPRVLMNRRTGGRTVKPVGRAVKMRPAKELRQRVAEADRVKGTGILVAKEGDERFVDAMTKEFTDAGIVCITAPTLKKAVQALGGRARAADFVVIAPSVPEAEYEKAVMDIKKKRTSAFLPVLRGAYDTSRYTRPSGFKILPDFIFSSPLEIVRQAKGNVERWREEKHYFRRQFKLMSASDMETINGLFSAFDTLAGRILSPASENYKFLSALHEAIENAAQHGNGGDPEKYVLLEWIEDPKKVTIFVEDEGEGFDYGKAREAASLESPEAVRRHMEQSAGTGGLGVKLMLEVFDKVEYSKGGKRLTLIKYKKVTA